MEPTELPPLWALDMAAKAALYADWAYAIGNSAQGSGFQSSIIAHARTLEELAQFKPEPVDPDRIALAGIVRALGHKSIAADLENGGALIPFVQAALAEFKRVKGGVS